MAVALAVLAAVPALAFQTSVQPFVIEPPLEPDSPYEYEALLSVGDKVPRTSNSAQQVQMVTIPDGLGALGRPDNDDRSRSRSRSRSRNSFVAPGSDFSVFMNQEHPKGEDQQFVIGQPEYQGAIISLFQMDKKRGEVQVESGDLAYDVVVDTLNGNRRHVPSQTNTDPLKADAFGRFCSGYLAREFKKFGFDRPIYFAGEESGKPGTYYEDKGGVATATFTDRGVKELRTLPDFGYFAWENIVPVGGYKGKTVLMGLEDGPSGYASQMYMYVGDQDRGSSDPMRRNGLVGGRLYVLNLPSDADERTYESGARNGEWVEIANARNRTDTDIATESQAKGFDHFRVEDGDQRGKNLVYATTGGDTTQPYANTRAADQPGNFYSRLYGLALNKRQPTGSARLSLEYDGDEAVSNSQPPNYRRGNALVSSDNLTLSPKGYLLVNEDATGYGDDFMTEKTRDAQVWRFKLRGGKGGPIRLDVNSARPVAEVSCIYDGGRDRLCNGFETDPGSSDPPDDPQGNGTWETSGIIDTDHVIGANTFLLDTQNHSDNSLLPPEPDYGVVGQEDGQLGVLLPKDDDDDGDDDGEDDDD